MATDRAADLRAALATSSHLAADLDAVLGRYQAGLLRVMTGVKPTVERTQALRAAREEVRAALADAELTLHHLDTPRRVEAAVLAGPEADLTAFLRALADLGAATAFLDPRKADLPAAEAAVTSAATLVKDGLALALRNFVTLLQLHGREGAATTGAGEGGDGEEGALDDEATAGGRWRPSDEGAPDGDDVDPYDSEGSEAASDGVPGGDTGPPGADPSPFLRVADFEPAPPPGRCGSAGAPAMPAPVTRRLRALADAMFAAGSATCVKAYCDVRRAQADAMLQALQAPVPLDIGAGMTDLGGTTADAGNQWVASWAAGVRGLAAMATSERDLAAALFDASHVGEAAGIVLGRAADLVVASGQGLIAMRRTPQKVTALLTMIGALTPVLADLEPALGNAAFAHILAKLRDLDEALQMEARASFDEFVAGIAMVDTWKRGSVESSVHPLVPQTLAHLEDMLGHAPVLAAVCGETKGCQGACTDISAAQLGVLSTDLAAPPPPSPAAASLILRALDALMVGMDAKARSNRSKVGAILFVMNDVQYLLCAITARPTLAACVPADRTAAWRSTVEAALRDLRATLWAPLVDLLGSDRPGGFSKESAKSVTASLQVVDEARSQLAIVDDDLRARVRDAVAAEVVEPYELLLTAVDHSIQKHLRYSAADVRGLVEGGDGFFVLRDDAAGGGGGAVSGPVGASASFKKR